MNLPLGATQVAALTILIAGCAPPDGRLQALAKAGAIEEEAPIKADASVVISAPAVRVWGLLTEIDRWPDWQQDIEKASLLGPLAPQTRFTWTTGGAEVRSTIAMVAPETAIAWTGRAFGLKAVHVWFVRPLGDGRVLVRTRESMDGFPVSLAYPSAKLQASDVRWLTSLKRAAEAAPAR